MTSPGELLGEAHETLDVVHVDLARPTLDAGRKIRHVQAKRGRDRLLSGRRRRQVEHEEVADSNVRD